jgi:retinol dehydrogenase 14
VHPLDRHRQLQRPGQGPRRLDDLHGERNNSGQRVSSQSKLANVMFTYELARRLAGTGVTATVLHPGVVRASFGAEDQAANFAVIRMARPFMKTPAEGAGTLVHLASRGRRRHRSISRSGV